MARGGLSVVTSVTEARSGGSAARQGPTKRSKEAIMYHAFNRVVVMGLFLAASAASLAAQQVATALGESFVGGRRVVVEVLVAVPPGADADYMLNAALRDQGARRLAADRFSTTGLVWPSDPLSDPKEYTIRQYYNSAGQPDWRGEAFTAAQDTWTNIADSSVILDLVDTTTRCPSLVKECPGKQSYDGYNDVSWLSIKGCCTLGVTWYGVGETGPETDMALNTNFSWGNGQDAFGSYDTQTVFLHELGHVLGLDHSQVLQAIMYATYQGERRVLDKDDIRGAILLYHDGELTQTISGHVMSGGSAVANATVSLDTTGLFAMTDGSGYYEIMGVPTIGSDLSAPDNTYNLTATASGYDSDTISKNVGDTTADFDLAAGDGGDGGGSCVKRGPFGFNCP